jgi:bacterioferritin
MMVQVQEKRNSASDQRELIEALNSDLAGELQAIVMYTTYAAKLTGPYRQQLRELFLAEVPDEQSHAQFLADKVALLGGEPVIVPRPVPRADNPRDMLENVLEAEVQAIADYTERAGQAEELGDVGLKVQLENQILDETKHRDEVRRILDGWR